MASATGQTRNNFEDKAHSAVSSVADKASEYANAAGHQVDRALDNAEHTARDAGRRVSEVADNMRTAVDKSVREQPMATLAVAAALGFVVGALWKS